MGDIATVTLIAGESKTAFQSHEERLFEASSFFKAAFTSNFKESSERTMTLSEDDVGAFEDFAHWLYTRGFEILPEPADAMFIAPLKLFVLADKYHVIDLKNIITEKIFNVEKRLEKAPSLTELAYTYAHTVQSSGIRKLFSDWHVWNIDLVWFERPYVQMFLRRHPDCATDFSVSLAKRFKTVRNTNDPFQAGMPEEHKDKEPRQES